MVDAAVFDVDRGCRVVALEDETNAALVDDEPASAVVDDGSLTPTKCAILSPETQKKLITQCAIPKFRVCWHKIAHFATSRWHRTEQHAIERSKYRVWLQDASQAQLIA